MLSSPRVVCVVRNVLMKLENAKEGRYPTTSPHDLCAICIDKKLRNVSPPAHLSLPPHKSSRRIWKVRERHLVPVPAWGSVCVDQRDGCGVEAFNLNPNLCKDKRQAEGRHEESTTSGPVGDGCTDQDRDTLEEIATLSVSWTYCGQFDSSFRLI